MPKDKMETHYQINNQFREKYLNNINFHIPEWSKKLVEIYTSPLKDKIKSKIKNAEMKNYLSIYRR